MSNRTGITTERINTKLLANQSSYLKLALLIKETTKHKYGSYLCPMQKTNGLFCAIHGTTWELWLLALRSNLWPQYLVEQGISCMIRLTNPRHGSTGAKLAGCKASHAASSCGQLYVLFLCLLLHRRDKWCVRWAKNTFYMNIMYCRKRVSAIFQTRFLLQEISHSRKFQLVSCLDFLIVSRSLWRAH